MWIHNYPFKPKRRTRSACKIYFYIPNNWIPVTQFVFHVCYFQLKSAGKQIHCIGLLQPDKINYTSIHTPHMMSITKKLKG